MSEDSNINLFKVESAENLIMGAIAAINKLDTETSEQRDAVVDINIVLNGLQTGELMTLRKVFE